MNILETRRIQRTIPCVFGANCGWYQMGCCRYNHAAEDAAFEACLVEYQRIQDEVRAAYEAAEAARAQWQYELEEYASVLVQRVWRGYKGRVYAAAERQAQVNASVLVQRVWRGYKGRVHAAAERQAQAAAEPVGDHPVTMKLSRGGGYIGHEEWAVIENAIHQGWNAKRETKGTNAWHVARVSGLRGVGHVLELLHLVRSNRKNRKDASYQEYMQTGGGYETRLTEEQIRQVLEAAAVLNVRHETQALRIEAIIAFCVERDIPFNDAAYAYWTPEDGKKEGHFFALFHRISNALQIQECLEAAAAAASQHRQQTQRQEGAAAAGGGNGRGGGKPQSRPQQPKEGAGGSGRGGSKPQQRKEGAKPQQTQRQEGAAAAGGGYRAAKAAAEAEAAAKAAAKAAADFERRYQAYCADMAAYGSLMNPEEFAEWERNERNDRKERGEDEDGM